MGLGAVLALLLSLVAAPQAEAGERGPICRVPEVLDVMTREIRRRDYYAFIDARLIDEVPEPAPNTVWCGVTVRTISYDARIAPDFPLRKCERHIFRVRALLNGYVVRYLR
jgi:hypothetical protein